MVGSGHSLCKNSGVRCNRQILYGSCEFANRAHQLNSIVCIVHSVVHTTRSANKSFVYHASCILICILSKNDFHQLAMSSMLAAISGGTSISRHDSRRRSTRRGSEGPRRLRQRRFRRADADQDPCPAFRSRCEDKTGSHQ